MKKRILTLLLLLSTLLSVLSLPLLAAGAVDVITIDQTTPYTDISSAKENDLPISMDLRYPLKPSASVDDLEVITVVETGYKHNRTPAAQDELALYVYVYYPCGRNIILNSDLHKITMATTFNKTDAAGNVQTDAADWRATDYEKYNLRLINHDTTSATGYNKYPLLKFQVDIDPAELADALGEQRRYEFSEIEIHFQNTTNAKSFTFGRSFICSGYRKGDGKDASVDDHAMTSGDVKAVVVKDIEQTHYDVANQDALGHAQTRINTVYFALDNDFAYKYGEVTSIKAEWFEAHSTPIVVTSDEELYYEYTGTYEGGTNYIGVNLSSSTGYPQRTIATYTTRPQYKNDPAFFYWQYNSNGPNAQTLMGSASPSTGNYLCGNIDQLCWFFKHPYNAGEKNEDKITVEWQQSLQGASVSTERLQEYYERFLADNPASYTFNRSGRNLYYLHTTGLVAPTVDEGRTYGWQSMELGGRMQIIPGYTTGSVFSDWFSKLFNKNVDFEAVKNHDVIEEVDYKILFDTKVDKEEKAKKYLVADADFQAFNDFCIKASGENKTAYVFHFAATDYFSEPLVICTNNGGEFLNLAYVAKGTMFFNFDMIQFTTFDEGVTMVVPVVMSPVDIMPDQDAPLDMKDPSTDLFGGNNNDSDWWDKLKTALMIALGVIAAIFVVVILVNIFGPAMGLVGAVGKGTGAAINGISRAITPKEKRKRKRRK